MIRISTRSRISTEASKHCAAHCTINRSEFWTLTQYNVSFHNNEPKIHHYLRYDDSNRFPLELLQQLICWTMFISVLFWPILISKLDVLNIFVVNIFIIIVPAISIIIFMKQASIKILHVIIWNVLSLVFSRIILGCFLATYVMQIDQHSKIDALSSFIQNGTDEKDKQERFISVHYCLLQRYFEYFENKQTNFKYIITEDLRKFRNIILKNYNQINENINISTRQFCEWQFLSPKQLSLICITSVSWHFYEIISPDICWKLFYMKQFSTTESMIYVYSSILLNIFISYYIAINILWSSRNGGKHETYLYFFVMVLFDLIIITYISNYAMIRNKWVYNFEDIYDKYHLHKLLIWKAINLEAEITAVYLYRKNKQEIMQHLLEVLCGHIGISQIILNYSMECSAYIGNNQELLCVCYQELCSYDGLNSSFCDRERYFCFIIINTRNRRWFTLIIDIILMVIMGYYTIWQWIILRIILMLLVLFGLFITCIKIGERFE